MLFGRGEIIRFTYNGANTKERFKQVLVINENWNGKVHALDLKRMTVAEREVLRFVMDPKNIGKTHRLPLANDIMRRMSPTELVSNPVAFYNQFVKPFIRQKDLYRTYFPQKMSGIQKIKIEDRRSTNIFSGNVWGFNK